MTGYMRRATENVLGPSPDFLAQFKAYGWYLDDLVLTAVDKLPRSSRVAACRAAKDSLAQRIAEYQPEAIVTVVLSIKSIVDAAVISAESTARRYALPFPGMSHQNRFMSELQGLIPNRPGG
jgi:hypothetical protein